jgi:DNA gyrase subunit B
VSADLRRSYTRMIEVIGTPPFRLVYGKKERKAETFEQLRHEALDLAKEGIQVGRFKGLGEMNPEELWETTMNPANRMLIQVGVEDAAAADRVFSMLMGDQVEPRRNFIESNAKDVRFLDV